LNSIIKATILFEEISCCFRKPAIILWIVCMDL